MINNISNKNLAAHVKPNVLGNMIDTLATKKKGANVGKISGSSNKPNTPTISKKIAAEPADTVQLSVNAINASQSTGVAKTTTGTKPFKVTPPAEHPMLERMRVLAAERWGGEWKESQDPVIVTSKSIVYDASGLSEGIESGEIQLIDSGLRVGPMSTRTYLEQINFYDGSIQNEIFGAFSGSMGKAEANLIATEISYLIKSAAVNNGDYIEERAVNRELGLRLAEHYANNFMEDSDEINAFMEVMKGFAERDEMLDKGYRFNGSEAYEYYKPAPGNQFQQNNWNNNVSNKDKERMANEFADNIKKAEVIINNSRATVTSDDVAALLEQIQGKLVLINDTIYEDTLIPNYQWLNETIEKHWSINYHSAMDGVTNFKIDLTQRGITDIKVDKGLLSEQGPLADRESSLHELRRNAALNGTSIELEPLYQEFMMDNMRHNFFEGTLERFITDALDDKARNSSFVAMELAKMIKSAAYGNGESIEERSINREIGMKNAEHIAKTYFDNPDEAKAFLDEINRFYEMDIMREKGYIVSETLYSEPFRSYSMPNAPEGYVSGKAIMKHFGASEEVMNDPEKSIRFLTSLNPKMQGGQFQIDIAKAFEENEKRITSILEQLKVSPLNDEDIANSLLKVLKAF